MASTPQRAETTLELQRMGQIKGRSTRRSARAEFDARQAAWTVQAEYESRQAELRRLEAQQADEIQEAAQNLLHFAQKEDPDMQEEDAGGLFEKGTADRAQAWSTSPARERDVRNSRGESSGLTGESGRRAGKGATTRSLVVVLPLPCWRAEVPRQAKQSREFGQHEKASDNVAVRHQQKRSAVTVAALTSLATSTTSPPQPRALQPRHFEPGRLAERLTIPTLKRVSKPMTSGTATTPQASIEQKSFTPQRLSTEVLHRETPEPTYSNTSTPISPYARTLSSQHSARDSYSSFTNSPQPAPKDMTVSGDDARFACSDTRSSNDFWNVVMIKEEDTGMVEDVKPPVDSRPRADTPQMIQSYILPNDAIRKALSALTRAGDNQVEDQPERTEEATEADSLMANEERVVIDDTVIKPEVSQVEIECLSCEQQDAADEERSDLHDSPIQTETVPDERKQEPTESGKDTAPDHVPEDPILPSEDEDNPEAPTDQDHELTEIREDPYSMDIDTEPPDNTSSPKLRVRSWEDPDYFLQPQPPVPLSTISRRSDFLQPRLSSNQNVVHAGLQPWTHHDLEPGVEPTTKLRGAMSDLEVNVNKMHDTEQSVLEGVPTADATGVSCQDPHAEPPDQMAESEAGSIIEFGLASGVESEHPLKLKEIHESAIQLDAEAQTVEMDVEPRPKPEPDLEELEPGAMPKLGSPDPDRAVAKTLDTQPKDGSQANGLPLSASPIPVDEAANSDPEESADEAADDPMLLDPPGQNQEPQLTPGITPKSITSARQPQHRPSSALLRQARKKENKKARLIAREAKGRSGSAVQFGRVKKQKGNAGAGRKGRKGARR